MPERTGVAEQQQAHATAAAFLAAWQSTQALWLASRAGAMPHEVAVLLTQAHATLDKATIEAERAGIVVVERDAQRRVTAIRAAEAET